MDDIVFCNVASILSMSVNSTVLGMGTLHIESADYERFLFMKRIAIYIFIACSLITMCQLYKSPDIGSSFLLQNPEEYNTRMKQDLLSIMLAYPEHIADVLRKSDGRVYLVMKSGRSVLYDDKVSKSTEGKISNADIEDMMEQAYPLTQIERLMDLNDDPGRRRVYGLLKDVYGETKGQIESNLVLVRTGFGSYQFNSSNQAAQALKRTMEELEAQAKQNHSLYRFISPIAGTYNYRVIAGTNRLSTHAFGIAIDLARDKRDYWKWASREDGQKRLESYPREIVEAFERNNFIWGGKWGHFDILHFEYRPEILLKSKYFGDGTSIAKPWYRGVPLEDPFVKGCIERIEQALEE